MDTKKGFKDWQDMLFSGIEVKDDAVFFCVPYGEEGARISANIEYDKNDRMRVAKEICDNITRIARYLSTATKEVEHRYFGNQGQVSWNHVQKVFGNVKEDYAECMSLKDSDCMSNVEFVQNMLAVRDRKNESEVSLVEDGKGIVTEFGSFSLKDGKGNSIVPSLDKTIVLEKVRGTNAVFSFLMRPSVKTIKVDDEQLHFWVRNRERIRDFVSGENYGRPSDADGYAIDGKFRYGGKEGMDFDALHDILTEKMKRSRFNCVLLEQEKGR